METNFFNDNLLLHSETAVRLYQRIAALPIVDYHSHLCEREIVENGTYSTITEFWLKHDHYKWRAMRICGVDEKYITGAAGDYEKFLAYATVMPKLIGNPLYFWTHMELKRIFGISEPLNAQSAAKIYARANEVLKGLTVRRLLKDFRVEYIATTDRPVSPLAYHGTYDGVRICPTFRTDCALKLDGTYLRELEEACGRPIPTLDEFCAAMEERLVYFISKGCSLADVSMETVPDLSVSTEEARALFLRRDKLNASERYRFYSYGMSFFAGLYAKYNITWQLHIGALRNVNDTAFVKLGADAGFDVMRGRVDTDAIAAFLDRLYETGRLPKIILYTLNANALPALCTVAGSFPNVRIGAAWWFNDTVHGIKNHLETLAEYSVLGEFPGMLTDSRCFSSYCRFDFFRRILADFVAGLVERGEYDEASVESLLYDICYLNPKKFIGL